MARVILVFLVAFVTGTASAAPLAVGDTLQPFSISDQHDHPGKLDATVRVLLVSRDMTANKLAKQAFLPKSADYLPAAHAMYAIDVSGMPGFVTRHFAIPKMQKYGYPIFLDREGTIITDLPTQKSLVTVIKLKQLKVESIEYVNSATALTNAVDGQP